MNDRRLVQVVLASVVATACARDVPIGDTEEPLIDGIATPSDLVSAASARIEISGSSNELCAGVLIAPRAVLTAAHCVHGWPGTNTLRISFRLPGSSVWTASVQPIDCVAHPNIALPCVDVPATVDIDRDLAILFLAETPSGIAPRPLAPPRSCLRDEDVPLATEVRGSRREGRASIVSGTKIRYTVNFFQEGDSGSMHYEPRLGSSGGVIGITSHDAPTAQATFVWGVANQDFIWNTLDPSGFCAAGASPGNCRLGGIGAVLPDSDGDGLPDVRDLCPYDDFVSLCSGNHCDADGDWVGDECDDYPGICNHADADRDGIPNPVDLCPLRSGVPADLSDADGDGIPNGCDTCLGFDDRMVSPSAPDTDGDGVVDVCDICPIPNPPGDDGNQPNCNFDAELATGGPFLGDQCDPTPCPIDESFTRSRYGGSTYEFDNWAFMGAGLATGSAQGTYRTGFRFCACADATEDSPAARARCEAVAPCTLSDGAYGTPGPTNPWRQPVLNFALFGPETVSGAGEIVTSYAADFSIAPRADRFTAQWTISAYHGTGYLPVTTLFDGVATLQRYPAVFWDSSRAAALADDAGETSGCAATATCPAHAAGLLNSHFSSGVFSRTTGLSIAAYLPDASLLEPVLPPPSMCPECGAAFPLPLIGRVCGTAGEPCIRFGNIDGPPVQRLMTSFMAEPEVTAGFNDTALRWLVPAEPLESIPRDSFRAIALTGAFDSAIYGVLAEETKLRRVVLGWERAEEQVGITGALQIFSARNSELFAFGGRLGQSVQTAVRAVSLLDSEPRAITLSGTLPDAVQSVALDPSARYALVLDRVGTTRNRLIRIDLRTGVSSLLYDDTTPTSFTSRAVASLPDGSWAMAAWTANGSPSFVHFRIGLATPTITVLRKGTGSGRVLGRFRGASRGLSWAGVDNTSGWLPRGILFTSMVAAGPNDLYALF